MVFIIKWSSDRRAGSQFNCYSTIIVKKIMNGFYN